MNISQDELAAASGVSKRTIAGFEAEKTSPIRANLIAIRRALEDGGVRFTERGVEIAEPTHA